MVSQLRQLKPPSLQDDVISIAHVMEPAKGTIIKDGFMPHPIAVEEERISPILVVGNHLNAKRLLAHHFALALV